MPRGQQGGQQGQDEDFEEEQQGGQQQRGQQQGGRQQGGQSGNQQQSGQGGQGGQRGSNYPDNKGTKARLEDSTKAGDIPQGEDVQRYEEAKQQLSEAAREVAKLRPRGESGGFISDAEAGIGKGG